MQIDELLKLMVNKDASDLHLEVRRDESAEKRNRYREDDADNERGLVNH